MSGGDVPVSDSARYAVEAARAEARWQAFPPANPVPRCKRCDGAWNGSHLLFCDACEEGYLDLMADAQAEDVREADTEIVL